MRRSFRIQASLLAVLSGIFGCVPEFDDDTSRVAAPRVLAIQSAPAEVRDRIDETATVTALVAGPDGSEAPEPFWSLCIDRKPLSELGPVSPKCIESPEPGAEFAESLGTGVSVEAAIPETACQLFGPQRPDPKPGEPSGRPVDPDPTGGYYQPVVAWLGSTAVLGAVRLGCALRDVDFNRRYRPNENPELAAFEAVRSDGSVLAFDPEEPVTLAPGERVNLRASFAECPAVDVCGDGICGPDEDQTSCMDSGDDCAAPRGCTGAERYVYFDSLAQSVSDRRESLTVSWYATDGTFDGPRTAGSASAGADGGPGSSNGYVAP
ncbi:MAG TPA: hypothetical protein VGK73_04750, partial [Polyangiaceae bacterium]